VVFRPAVIAREFPEGAFELLRVWRDHALDRDLGARRVEEARRLALHQLDGPAQHAADEVELRDGLGEGLRSRDEERGVDAPAADDLAGLVPAPVPLAVQARLLPRRQGPPDLTLAPHRRALPAP